MLENTVSRSRKMASPMSITNDGIVGSADEETTAGEGREMRQEVRRSNGRFDRPSRILEHGRIGSSPQNTRDMMADATRNAG